MPRPNTQRTKRPGPGEWRSEYFLVLYINGVKTRVKVPLRDSDGLEEKVVKINNARYFYQIDTERKLR